MRLLIVGHGKMGRLVESLAPDYGFEEAAVEAIRQWRYRPATRNGQPVSVYFTVLVEFKLQ